MFVERKPVESFDVEGFYWLFFLRGLGNQFEADLLGCWIDLGNAEVAHLAGLRGSGCGGRRFSRGGFGAGRSSLPLGLEHGTEGG